MLFGAEPKSARQTVYTPALLRDAKDITIEMSRRSSKRQKGWVFSQLYNSCKEMWDAMKKKPFRSPFLSKLTWDPKIRKMVDQQGKAVTATASQLKGSFQASKSRLACSLQDGEKRSFGVREEHRISLAFLLEMKHKLERIGSWDRLPTSNPSNQPFWEIPSRTYTTFLLYNANKILLVFERILTMSRNGYVSYEHSKVLAMLLHALQHCYDSVDLKRQRGLWEDAHQLRRDGPIVQGMGLQRTIEESGYGWFLPKIDWTEFVFRADLSGQMSYSNTTLRDTHRKNWVSIKHAKDDLKQLEVIGQWLNLYQSEHHQWFLFRMIIALVLRQFRKNVFSLIKSDILPEYQEAALAGKVMLCWTSLQNVLVDQGGVCLWGKSTRISVIRANRSKIRTVKEITDLLWNFDDGAERRRWEHYGYRAICQRALQLAQIHCGASSAGILHDQIKRAFVATNWIIPYANSERFWPTSQRHRSCLSIFHPELLHSRRTGQTIPYEVLMKETQDRKSRDAVEFMYKWRLEGEVEGDRVLAIPQANPSIFCQDDTDLNRVGEELEQIWEEMHPED